MAASTRFEATIHGDAAWHPGGPVHSPFSILFSPTRRAVLPVRPNPQPLLRPRGGVPMLRRPQPPTQRGGPRLPRSGSQQRAPSSPQKKGRPPPAPPRLRRAPTTREDAWDFAVTSCIRAPNRKPQPLTVYESLKRTFHNTAGRCHDMGRPLTVYESLKRTFHNTAGRCHDTGIRFIPMVFDGHADGWDFPACQLYLSPRTQRHQSRLGPAHLFATPP